MKEADNHAQTSRGLGVRTMVALPSMVCVIVTCLGGGYASRPTAGSDVGPISSHSVSPTAYVDDAKARLRQIINKAPAGLDEIQTPDHDTTQAVIGALMSGQHIIPPRATGISDVKAALGNLPDTCPEVSYQINAVFRVPKSFASSVATYRFSARNSKGDPVDYSAVRVEGGWRDIGTVEQRRQTFAGLYAYQTRSCAAPGTQFVYYGTNYEGLPRQLGEEWTEFAEFFDISGVAYFITIFREGGRDGPLIIVGERISDDRCDEESRKFAIRLR